MNKDLLKIAFGSFPVVLAGISVFAGFQYVNYITARDYVNYHYDGDWRKACNNLDVPYDGRITLSVIHQINNTRFK